jgi:hypothetical protein
MSLSIHYSLSCLIAKMGNVSRVCLSVPNCKLSLKLLFCLYSSNGISWSTVSSIHASVCCHIYYHSLITSRSQSFDSFITVNCLLSCRPPCVLLSCRCSLMSCQYLLNQLLLEKISVNFLLPSSLAPWIQSSWINYNMWCTYFWKWKRTLDSQQNNHTNNQPTQLRCAVKCLIFPEMSVVFFTVQSCSWITQLSNKTSSCHKHLLRAHLSDRKPLH